MIDASDADDDDDDDDDLDGDDGDDDGDVDGNGNGISRGSRVMMRQAQHYKKKLPKSCSMDPGVFVESFNRTRWLEKLSTKGGWAGGPDGTYRDHWYSHCRKKPSHASSLCWGPC